MSDGLSCDASGGPSDGLSGGPSVGLSCDASDGPSDNPSDSPSGDAARSRPLAGPQVTEPSPRPSP
ncbi:hypothetical protein ACIQVC_08800 [Streptomyces sp. NPDC101112]|uniref:hypothetical protein n=1 Tax=Streptomyces sp. NPDC101112 TaxID=3366105 RepID=UPI0037FD26C7